MGGGRVGKEVKMSKWEKRQDSWEDSTEETLEQTRGSRTISEGGGPHPSQEAFCSWPV